MNKLTIFENEQFGKVRTSKGNNGEALFVMKDVCDCLGIKDHKQASKTLDDDEKRYAAVGTDRGVQKALVINESGLCHLIFTSRKEEAKALRRWVTKEVIPSIVRTGKYEYKKPHEIVAPLSLHTYLQKYTYKTDRGRSAHQIAEKIWEIAAKLCTGEPMYLYDIYKAAVDCGVETISCDMGSQLARLVIEAMRNNGYRVEPLKNDRYTFSEWGRKNND